MLYIRYFTVLFLMWTSSAVIYSQNTARIVLDAEYDGEMVRLSWAPTNDTTWALGNKYGYSISRRDVANKTMLLAKEIKPKPMSWFEQNQQLDNGFIYVIGKILYDPEYNKQLVHESLTNQRIQYDYLVPEAIRSPLVARSLGLNFLDSTCIAGQNYTYNVSFKDSPGALYQGEIAINLNGESTAFQTHELSELKFDPPGGTPLFNMRKDLDGLKRIEVVAKAYQDSIVLRWAPNDHVYWALTKNEPYAVFKVVSSKDPSSSEAEYILQDSIKPWTLEMFTPQMVAKDSLILVAAQSLYGTQESSDSDGLIIQHSESVMRYGMAMLAADRSPLAATALGLRFVDKHVKVGETYRYLILTRAAENVMENGYIDIINQADTLSRIQGFYAEKKDKKVNLVWSKLNDQQFSGYLLERSDDNGKTFKPINESPLLFVQNEHSRDDGNYSFLDSLGSNYEKYIYGIRGIDAFGDTSEVSIITAYGVDLTPPSAPAIYFAESIASNKIQLKWQMPEDNYDLDKFHILLSESLDGDYEPVATNLPGTNRSYDYSNEINTNRSYYFIVVAQDTAGNQRMSLPTYVQIVDSIPPAAPINLRGIIDSMGIATITWDQGKEEDLIGYRIYMANNPEHEFAQLTKESTAMNLWHDSIELVALDKKVYYKVAAVDRSNNFSAFSTMLSLDRPDIVRPGAPAARPTSSDTKGVKLFWSLSPSNDVVAYIIYRKNVSKLDTSYHRIIRIQNKVTAEWLDSTAVYEQIYEYIIKAQDRSGLLSDATFPVKGRRMFDVAVLKIESLVAEYKKEYGGVYLRWNNSIKKTDFEIAPKFYYYLYRKVNEEPWKKIKQLDAAALSFLDRELKTNGSYKYGIKIVTEDGKSGVISESNNINYTKD